MDIWRILQSAESTVQDLLDVALDNEPSSVTTDSLHIDEIGCGVIADTALAWPRFEIYQP